MGKIATPKKTTRRDVTINLRASQEQRALIDSAAQAVGKTRSEFMLDAARAEAQNVFLDQRHFFLDDKQYQEFLDILDAPPKVLPALRDLMARTPLWEK